MWKTVGTVVWTLVLMVVSGVGTFAVVFFILAVLGVHRHDNYEYYGKYPVILWGPVAIGFLAPGVVAWHRHKRGTRKGQSQ